MSYITATQSTKLLDEIDLRHFDNIIGFDLGHGEFSVFCISDQRLDSPTCVEINRKRTQITAVSVTYGEKVLIGNDAISSYGDIKELWVGFKRRPNGDAEFNRKMQMLFSEAILKSQTSGKVKLTKNTLILVGCPSEWSNEEQEKYQNILQNTFPKPLEEYPTVAVIPESRAAIQCARVSGHFSINELQTSIVTLLDFGSSTVDVTVLQSGQDIHDEDDGCDLGAFLLDQLIFCEIVRQVGEKEYVEIFRDLKYKSSNIGRCLLKARELKELYFNQEESSFKENRMLSKGGEELESQSDIGSYLDFKLSMGQIHNLIYNTPVGQIEEYVNNWGLPEDLFFFPSPEYSNCSYFKALTKFIKEANNKLKGNYQNKIVTKTLLTGGAARMGLVKNIIESVFSQSTNVFMNDPETNVATGLALRGRAEVLSARFVSDVNEDVFSEIGDTIIDSIDNLYSSISESVVEAVNEVIDAEIVKACNSSKQPRDLAEACATEMNFWIRDGNLESKVKLATDEWFTSNITEKVNDSLSKLAMKHSIPAIIIKKDTALRMAKSIDITPIVNVLTIRLQGSIITNAINNNMTWFDKILRFFDSFDLGYLNSEQRIKFKDEIRYKIQSGVVETLKNDINLLRGLEETLTDDIQMEIKKIIVQETCAYL